MRGALLAAALGLIAGAPAARSGEAAPPVRAAGPLAGFPSAPGAHIEKIRAMADDSWLELGSPEADPKWGKARGRSWTPEMILAPEMLKRQPYDQSAAVYDPELNVHFYFGAGDSSDKGLMWAYRHKNVKK